MLIADEILHASDELAQIFDKYKDVMVIRERNELKNGKSSSSDTGPSLLDFGPSDDVSGLLDDVKFVTSQCEVKSEDYDVLCDLFMANVPNSTVHPQKEILKPVYLSSEAEALGKPAIIFYFIMSLRHCVVINLVNWFPYHLNCFASFSFTFPFSILC